MIKTETNGQSNNANSSNSNNNSQQVTNNRANLIVNYLPQSLKEQEFNQLFSRIGPLKACKLMFDRTTGKHRLNHVAISTSNALFSQLYFCFSFV